MADTPSTRQPRPKIGAKDAMNKTNSKEEVPKKTPEASQEVGGNEVEKCFPPFNFEHEMDKIKIFVSFNELIKKGEYRDKIIKMMKMGGTPDTLNVQDDHPTIIFGLHIEDTSDTEEVPSFYVNLKVHDMTLHNTMLDSGASHNLMPKVIMDKLGLDIIRPYKDLFSFDSRKFKCLGLIKYLVM
jgi:hypothetical protein